MLRTLLAATLLVAISAGAAEPELRLELTRQSLTGTHERYRQYIDGLPVVGGEVTITRDARGAIAREERRLARTDGTVRAAVTALATHIVNVDGVPRPARRTITGGALRPIAEYRDAVTNELLRIEPLFFTAKPARVFEQNPVAKLNDPSLRDRNDAASAVPQAAYSDVTLETANAGGPLAGTFVTITDFENPAIPPVDAGAPLLFDREQDGFEDVNAFFHIERTQQYLRSIGYTGDRALVAYSIPLDPHGAGGTDNSFYVSSSIVGRGSLVFGDGGTDDAEDSDLVVHEYGHAMLDWISPLTFAGAYASEARALGEGFCDYWSFSQHYEGSIATGRDASCFADWDARCDGDDPSQRCAYQSGADCLRRVDGTKTMADFSRVDSSGTEHKNGEIWSSAMRDIFLIAGKQVTDTLAIEAVFGMPPNPTFADYARRLLFTDRVLYGDAHVATICSAMTARGILTAADCGGGARGSRHYFQGVGGVAIPDNTIAGITSTAFVTAASPPIESLFVRVDIDHAARGDLRIVLIAPDGSQFVLQNIGIDGAPGLHVTYGLDAQPAESLAPLRGHSPAGTWTLSVSDRRPRDTGVLVSWSLILVGSDSQTERSRAAFRQIVPVVGHVAGVGGTRFVSDVRIGGAALVNDVTLTFTPSGADGRTTFASVDATFYGAEVLAFDDVVRTLFDDAGIGQLEIGSSRPLVVSTRTHTVDEDGTLGEHLPAVTADEGADALTLPVLQRDADFRTNYGVAETAGIAGRVRIAFFDAATGALVAEEEHELAPHGHFQLPLTREGFFSADLTVTGGARIAAYASVVDNRSGDAIHVTALPPGVGGGIAPAIDAPGVESHWRTDAYLSAGAAGSATAVRYARAGGATTSVELPRPGPHQTVRRTDIVRDVFFSRGTFGVVQFPEQTAAVLRVFTDAPGGGTLGQAVPLAREPHLSGDVLFIENGGAFRTNVGAVNFGTPATVRFTVFEGGTSLGTAERQMAAADAVQLPLTEIIGSRLLLNGRVRIERIGPSGVGDLFSGYASIIDNRSGDPSYIPAR